MNGLEYIRTRCNISQAELADILQVTKQAISMRGLSVRAPVLLRTGQRNSVERRKSFGGCRWRSRSGCWRQRMRREAERREE